MIPCKFSSKTKEIRGGRLLFFFFSFSLFSTERFWFGVSAYQHIIDAFQHQIAAIALAWHHKYCIDLYIPLQGPHSSASTTVYNLASCGLPKVLISTITMGIEGGLRKDGEIVRPRMSYKKTRSQIDMVHIHVLLCVYRTW